MSKAGRKKSYTADYFPHKVEKTAELEFLENMFKEKFPKHTNNLTI